jgi:hypothetical protein
MLHRAVILREVSRKASFINKHSIGFQPVDTFVSYMARDESDRVKRAKLDALQLSDEEWERAKLFLSLLKV